MLLDAAVKSKWLPTFTKRDRRVINVIAPVMWVLIASTTYVSFAKGNIGEGIGHTGMLIIFFATMVGPHMWAVVEDTDVTLRKALAIMIAFGFLTMATGWLIRFVT